jgi:hypothetical protein
MDAHEREYIAAAEAVAGDRPPTAEHGPAVGDLIWFKLGDWNYPKSGRVIDTTPLKALIVVTDGGDRHLVWPDEVTRQ